MSRHTFKTAADVKEPFYVGIRLVHLSKLLGFNSCINRYIQLLRNQFSNGIYPAVRHSECASNVPYRSSCSKSTKRYNLSNLIFAVFSLNVIYYLLASVITEVDIKIGHRHSLGVQKSLKKQIKCNRVNVGYANAKCNEASRARSSSGTDGNFAVFSVGDEIAYDKEVGVEAHFIYNRQFVFNPVKVLVPRVRRKIEPPRIDKSLETNIGITAKLFLVRKSVLWLEIGQMELIKFKIEIALLCYFYSIFNSALVACKEALHLLGRFEVEFIGLKSERLTLGDNVIRLNAHKYRLHFRIFPVDVVNVVGSDHRDTVLLAYKLYAVSNLALVVKIVVLHLKIKVLAKYRAEFKRTLFCFFHTARENILRYFSGKASGKRNQSFMPLAKKVHINSWSVIKTVNKALRNHITEIFISRFIFTK